MENRGARTIPLVVLYVMHCACASSRSEVRPKSPAQTPPDGTISEYLESGMKIGDRCFGYRVTDGDVANTPEWDPETGRPPVTILEAVEASRPQAANVLGTAREIGVTKIALYQNKSTERWFYLISWRPKEMFYSGDTFDVVVLMDGRAMITQPVTCSDPDYYWSSDEADGTRQ